MRGIHPAIVFGAGVAIALILFVVVFSIGMVAGERQARPLVVAAVASSSTTTATTTNTVTITTTPQPSLTSVPTETFVPTWTSTPTPTVTNTVTTVPTVTATSVPPTATVAPPTVTPIPPSATSVPPTDVPTKVIPPTAIPPTAAPAKAATATSAPVWYSGGPIGPIKIETLQSYSVKLGNLPVGMRVGVRLTIAYNNPLSSAFGTPDLNVYVFSGAKSVQSWAQIGNGFTFYWTVPDDAAQVVELYNRSNLTAKKASLVFYQGQ